MMKIKKTPFEIIENYSIDTPVDVRGLARELGLSVYDYTPETSTDSGVLVHKDLVEGIDINSDSAYVILVNSAHHENRKRFTIAHEIAHFVLHKPEVEKGAVSENVYYRSRLSNAIETQANQFAANNILMPIRLIQKEISALEGQNIDSKKFIKHLAQKFQVSEQAMTLRIGFLNVIDLGLYFDGEKEEKLEVS